MVNEKKLIRISDELKKHLDNNRLIDRETYDGVIKRLLKIKK